MTKEQRVAFTNAQTAIFNCRVAGMVAENQARMRHDQSPAYTEASFAELEKEFEGVLGHNALLTFFNFD